MEPTNCKICPWWLGYTLLIPTRKYQHNPEKILTPLIKPGMTVMDFGCAMGYFSIPLAKMVGNTGKVYCVDIQEKMLGKLQKRAEKYGVSDEIKPLLVNKNYNPADLKEQLDFVMLFYVVHEVPDKQALFTDIFSMLKPGGKVLFVEPAGHVSNMGFELSVNMAKKAGFTVYTQTHLNKGMNVILEKKG
jgi:2-polyprenyl-3-methyl-5-hydroxy-6-metoxy-1,4-benzoquinol methylase